MLSRLFASCCQILLNVSRRCLPLLVSASLRTGIMQGQRSALIMVIVIVAVVFIISSYNGLLPFLPLFIPNDPVILSSGPPEKVTELRTAAAAVTLAPGIAKQPVAKQPVTEQPAVEGEFTYGIIFDAGSTGSRLHVFKLQHLGPGKPLKLIHDLFQSIKPGLSAYAQEPKKAAASLVSMLESAKQYVPEKLWSSTVIALKATAGLRQLPASSARNILAEITTLFKKYPFKMSKDSVRIMEGNDEGIFSWFTVNFLTGSLGNTQHMLGVMDLGGGSTQATFIPTQEETIKSVPKGFLTGIDLFDKTYQLYTHSYMGLGLMTGRLQTLSVNTPSQQKGVSVDSLSSECFAPTYNGTWKQSNKLYMLRGVPSTPAGRFDKCYHSAQTVVTNAHIDKPQELRTHPFCIISYYYDVAVEAGLIEKEKGGELRVGDFLKAAKAECTRPNDSHPFLCLDLCYITALLRDGFGFNDDTKVQLRKQIKGTEISWALGAMFRLINKQHNSKATDGG